MEQVGWNRQTLRCLIWSQGLHGQAGLELHEEDGRQWIAIPPPIKVRTQTDGWRFIRIAED